MVLNLFLFVPEKFLWPETFLWEKKTIEQAKFIKIIEKSSTISVPAKRSKIGHKSILSVFRKTYLTRFLKFVRGFCGLSEGHCPSVENPWFRMIKFDYDLKLLNINLLVYLLGIILFIRLCWLNSRGKEQCFVFSGQIDWSKVLASADKERTEHWAKFEPIIKDFYIEHDDVADMTKMEVDRWR